MIPFSRDGAVVTARLTGNEVATLEVLATQFIELLGNRSADAQTGGPEDAQTGGPENAETGEPPNAGTRTPEGADASDALYAQLGIGGSSARPLDPALARLLPDAYRDDAEAASEHRRLTERGLVDRKVANARAVIGSLRSATTTSLRTRTGSTHRLVLDEADVQSWLRTLTDLRLTIAARLQIEEEGDEGIGDDAMLAVYDWLGYLQGTLVATIDAAGNSG